MLKPAVPSDVSRIAIVGCGAVVEQNYLPALGLCAGISCEALVDPDLARIRSLAARYGVPNAVGSLDDVPTGVQGVVIAVPNDLHVKVAMGAFDRRLHVLCEKPLGRNTAEVQTMAAGAGNAGLGFFAAMICRRYPAVRETVMHQLYELVGELQDIDASYGFPLDWPVKSPSFYDKARAGGGALLDFGAHMIDALLHVLGNPSFDVISYADDADSGVDAEAEGRIGLMLPQGLIECRLRTSRLRRLPNTLSLRGAYGTLQIPLSPIEPAMLSVGNGSWPVTRQISGILPCFVEQLEDFGRAIRHQSHELPPASSQASPIGLIEQMYSRRQPLVFAWDA